MSLSHSIDPSLVEDLSEKHLDDVALSLLQREELLCLADVADETGIGWELLDLDLGAARIHQVNNVDVDTAQGLSQQYVRFIT